MLLALGGVLLAVPAGAPAAPFNNATGGANFELDGLFLQGGLTMIAQPPGAQTGDRITAPLEARGRINQNGNRLRTRAKLGADLVIAEDPTGEGPTLEDGKFTLNVRFRARRCGFLKFGGVKMFRIPNLQVRNDPGTGFAIAGRLVVHRNLAALINLKFPAVQSEAGDRAGRVKLDVVFSQSP